jgi:hypothetical protein
MAFYKHRVGIDKDQPLFLNSCSNRKESEDFEEQKTRKWVLCRSNFVTGT